MGSRFETITDDNLLQVLLTQPGMVYLDSDKFGTLNYPERYNAVPHPHMWLASGRYTESRLRRLRDGRFVVLVEEDSDG